MSRSNNPSVPRLTLQPGSFNPSHALFRQAVTSAKEAAAWAMAHAERRLIRGVPNLGQREFDACVVTVLCAHAALESEWHWQHVLDDLQPPRWPGGFDDGLTKVAERRRRGAPGETSRELRDRLGLLGAWRNYFQHGDGRARERLAEHGQTVDDLDAAYASDVIDAADALFERIWQATGGQRVGPSAVLWTGLPPIDE
jgi:hypothetical protein